MLNNYTNCSYTIFVVSCFFIAIEAMKNAHREELQRELEKTHRSQISGMNADVEDLGKQHK